MQPYKSLQMDNFVIPLWTAKGFSKCFELLWIREWFKIVIILLPYVSVVWFCLFSSFIAIKFFFLLQSSWYAFIIEQLKRKLWLSSRLMV